MKFCFSAPLKDIKTRESDNLHQKFHHYSPLTRKIRFLLTLLLNIYLQIQRFVSLLTRLQGLQVDDRSKDHEFLVFDENN